MTVTPEQELNDRLARVYAHYSVSPNDRTFDNYSSASFTVPTAVLSDIEKMARAAGISTAEWLARAITIMISWQKADEDADLPSEIV